VGERSGLLTHIAVTASASSLRADVAEDFLRPFFNERCIFIHNFDRSPGRCVLFLDLLSTARVDSGQFAILILDI